MSDLEQAKELVIGILDELYSNESKLFKLNKGKGLCERCIVFRFAYHLQNKLKNYYVDCDFNSSYETTINSDNELRVRNVHGKPIIDENGTTNRFVDIIVHKRNPDNNDDYLCFEMKRWTNTSKKEKEKDFNNLKDLTTRYNYKFGFHIIFGKTKEKTKWSIFKDGQKIIDNKPVFN